MYAISVKPVPDSGGKRKGYTVSQQLSLESGPLILTLHFPSAK